MEFITWWLEKHWIISTFFTPGITFLWCVFKGDLVLRGAIALLWYVVSNASVNYNRK